jgi:hypothetical protein
MTLIGLAAVTFAGYRNSRNGRFSTLVRKGALVSCMVGHSEDRLLPDRRQLSSGGAGSKFPKAPAER